MSLWLQSRRVGGVVVMTCSGRIAEGAETSTLQQRLYDVIPDTPYIVLHLGGVDFVDSGGLGLLVRVLGRARAAGGDLKLCASTVRIIEILRITRLNSVFESHPSEDAAIAAFYERAKSPGGRSRLGTEVLCVDPSEDVLAYVGEVLRQVGYGVMTSTNLSDALVLLKASPPRLVVIAAKLRASRTDIAEVFNTITHQLRVVELAGDFSHRDAGDAGRRLLDQVRTTIGEPEGSSRV